MRTEFTWVGGLGFIGFVAIYHSRGSMNVFMVGIILIFKLLLLIGFKYP